MAKKIIEYEDPDLRAVIGKQINNALGYMGGALSTGRKKSLEYYLGMLLQGLNLHLCL